MPSNPPSLLDLLFWLGAYALGSLLFIGAVILMGAIYLRIEKARRRRLNRKQREITARARVLARQRVNVALLEPDEKVYFPDGRIARTDAPFTWWNFDQDLDGCDTCGELE